MLNRRLFVASAGAMGIGLATAGLADEPNVTADQIVTGKDRRLIVLDPKIAVLETPLSLLDRQITPLELLFVRNNQQPKGSATLAPWSLEKWQVEIGGSVDKSRTFQAELLREIEQVETEMVLQCSGNSRSLFSLAAQTKGTQWGRGGMGNIRVGGVRLSTLLDKLQVRIKKSAKFLRVEGKDQALPGKEDFEHSMPLDDALNRSIVATQFNGKPIPAIHGGPVRLMTPGIFGTMQLKWISALHFESEESTNYNHVPRYRTPKQIIRPGEDFKFTLSNSVINWRMKVKSVILTPAPNAMLPRGEVEVRGVAFNDGAVPIESVLISSDQGQRWVKAKLEKATGRYAWRRWGANVKLASGPQTIWSRAVDGLGRSQPLDGSVHWNPRGYEWNGVEKIDVQVMT